MSLRSWIAGVACAVGALAGSQAVAADAGLMIVGSTALDNPNGSVVLLDLGSVTRNGDLVTAKILMVMTNSQDGEARGVSHMIGEESLNCKDRMTVTSKIAAYSEEGIKIGEFDTGDAPKLAAAGTPWRRMLDRVCDGPDADGEAEPFADVAEAVSFVRGVVSAVQNRTSPMLPHRYVFVGQMTNSAGSRTAAFVDMANLEHDGDAVVRWVVLINTPPIDRGGVTVLYDLTQMSFDCASGRARIRYAEAIGTNGSTLFGGITVTPWMRSAGAGTLGDMQLKAGCDAGLAGAEGLESLEAAAEYARRVTATPVAPAPGQRGI